MGLFDLFKMGKILVGTAKAVREQRTLGRDIASLPMAEFVAECVQNLNQSAGNWEGRARPPSAQAALLASEKKLPAELQEFYLHCDGFEAIQGEFPAAIFPVGELRLGADYQPTLSARLAGFWAEHGNDSEKPDLLSILPPDSLAALVTNSADCYLRPSLLEMAIPLCKPDGDHFVVVLLADAGRNLPAGTVLDVEGGSATRYPSFKAWLGSYASMFGSISQRFGAYRSGSG
jgi:hypothetical protein